MEKLKHKNTEAKAACWLGTKESEIEIRSLGVMTEMQDSGVLLVSTPFGVAVAQHGDFVVNDAGRVGVFSPSEFKAHFEGVP